MKPPNVAVLFARRDSCYKLLGGVDVYDADRDARSFTGGCPVIAHPPCRSWGRLRNAAHIVRGEKELARFAVRAIWANSGVLEHPAGSLLWDDMGLPKPGVDIGPGFTLEVNQCWWGHLAQKKTWLYFYGIPANQIPRLALSIHRPPRVINSSKAARQKSGRKEVTKAQREATPIDLALWLVAAVARQQKKNK